MSGIQLISIKRTSEENYYDNKGATFGGKNTRNNATTPVKQPSKKARKASEKKERKEQEKEQKQLEKERKKLGKENSKKHKTQSAGDARGTIANGDVSGQVNSAVSKETLDDQNNQVHIQETSRNDESSLDSGLDTSRESTPTNGPSSGHVIEETITTEGAHQAEDFPPDTMVFAPSGKQEEVGANQGHVEIEISEVINELEDVPDDHHGEVTYYVAGAAAENEIMVATVHEVESSSNEVDSFFNELGEEESGEEVDDAAVNEGGVTVMVGESEMKVGQGEKKRKSVRFQEYQSDKGDVEHEEAEEEKHRIQLELVQESIHREDQSKVESSEIDWDDMYKESDDPPSETTGDHRTVVVTNREVVVDHRDSMLEVESQPENRHGREADEDDRTVVVVHREAVVHHRENAEVESEPSGDVVEDNREGADRRESIGDDPEGDKCNREVVVDHRENVEGNNNDQLEIKNINEDAVGVQEKVERKEKRKRSLLMRCCFP